MSTQKKDAFGKKTLFKVAAGDLVFKYIVANEVLLVAGGVAAQGAVEGARSVGFARLEEEPT